MFDEGPPGEGGLAVGALLHGGVVHRPLLRLWVARVRIGREAAYEAFAETISRPMLLQHAGCRSVNFMRLRDGYHAVLTQWRGADDVVALQLSKRYQDTVRQLRAADLLEAVAPVSLWPVPTDLVTWARALARRVERGMALASGSALSC